MNCPEEAKFEAMLNGVLDENESARLVQHKNDCSKCEKIYIRLISLDRLIASTAPQDMDDELLSHVKEEVWKLVADRAEARLTRMLPSQIFWGIIHAAAAIIVVVSAWKYFAFGSHHNFKIKECDIDGVQIIRVEEIESSVARNRELFQDAGIPKI